MNNTIYKFKRPLGEPILSYATGSAERIELERTLAVMSAEVLDIPIIIGGREIRTGLTADVVMPHSHSHKLGTYHIAGEAEIREAISSAVSARESWSRLPWTERASVMLRTADLIAGKYRYLINAATMLGQSKNAFQAEIDSACELIDFLRFNVYFASQIYADQPESGSGVMNRLEYRSLEGFVFTVSPFNFTAIAGNLNISPVLMGNATVWKPASTSVLSNYYLMKIMEEAGLPAGVINFVPSRGSDIGRIVFADKDFAGVHFTGSTGTFNSFWRSIADNMSTYRSYPRIIGETGGKDFVVMHPSASPRQVAVALARGSFEYQGQKCSAASRAYIPVSQWDAVLKHLTEMVGSMKMGDVRDLGNFINAVIDRASFDNIAGYISRAKSSDKAKVVIGGTLDDSIGYFVSPTVILTTDPHYESMTEEIFGPVLTVYVYEDESFADILTLCDTTSPYALTGSIFSNDIYATQLALDKLRFAAGNFYINDKPTGAVVGQQPFGGARASGTNDKAGSYMNLLRWTSPRTVKETFDPPTEYGYPFLK